MMNSAALTYPDWKAPGEDSATLIWPSPRQLLDDTLQNHRRLSKSLARLQNVPIGEIRKSLRASLGLIDEQPAILTGHQAELYHSGVWAKLALIDAAASQINAAGLHISVDTDAPKHLHLKWPGEHSPLAITDDPKLPTAEWTALLAGPSDAHLAHLRDALRADSKSWGFQPALKTFFDAIAKSPREALPAILANATQAVDAEIGLRHDARLLSSILASPAYLLLVHHILAHADLFAAAYNLALHEYRLKNRVRSDMRPMPNLALFEGACETPFWFDDLGVGTRDRATVDHSCTPKRFCLVVAGDGFELDPTIDGWEAADKLGAFLKRHDCRLAPRALTLTLTLRLLAADQWVHGIGGGRYDQVTDRLIEGFFHVPAPAFAVTTATLFFPTAVGRERECLPCVQQEGHRLKHGVLGDRKREFLQMIEQQPRGSGQRKQSFNAMHTERNTLLKTSPPIRQWEDRLASATLRATEEQTLFDRELFYALQPPDRLRKLIDAYRVQF